MRRLQQPGRLFLNYMNHAFDLAGRLPAGIDSVVIEDVAGLDVHCLVAGDSTNPLILLLHGFPELAYSWRKVMPTLAQSGYFVVAPDQRGYGLTRASQFRGTDNGWVVSYASDFSSSSLCRMAGDARNLVAALGFHDVHAVIGHDFGSPVAAVCALLRPDIFKSVALMSAPFSGAADALVRQRFQAVNSVDTTSGTATSRSLDSSTPAGGKLSMAASDLPSELLKLKRPREHYQWYYSGANANDNMWKSPQGLKVFFRNYYHHKSADWLGNNIYPLTESDAATPAEQFARLPTYYVMDAGQGMAETVLEHAPDSKQVADCQWLTEAELEVYVALYQRTGFQGGLQSYRCNTSGLNSVELQIYGSKTIDVPSIFIAGAHDWGVYQFPGDIEQLESSFTSDFYGIHLLDGAGHWVQQEQPEAVLQVLMPWLN